MKKLITWLYSKYVGDIYIPPHTRFSIGIGGCERANAKHYNSFIPDVLKLSVDSNGWKDIVLRQ